MSHDTVSIGIDISKKKLQLVWLKSLNPLAVKFKSLPNSPEGHRDLLQWVLKNSQAEISQLRITLEPTNIYHEGIALYLYDQGCQVCLVNPKQVNDFASSLGNLTKNDRKDSVILARFGLVMNPRCWQPAPLEIRQLETLLNRLDTLQDTLQQEKNRLDALSLREHYPESVEHSLMDSIEYLKRSITELEKQINQHIDRHPTLKKDQRLLESIPGIASLTAQRMIAVIRSRDFNKASEVAAFLGLIPIERTSGSSVHKKPRLSKRGNPAIRGKLYMPVVAAIAHNSVIRTFYYRLLEHKKHQRAAFSAAMRKLVHICFGVLKNQTVFDATA